MFFCRWKKSPEQKERDAMSVLLWYVWCTGHGRTQYDPDRWRTVGKPV